MSLMPTLPRLIAACRCQPVDRTPVWFMRQAGRIFPAYRALREEYDFLTLCSTPELAAKVTLMPVERLGVDAAIIFADIMLPLAGMGVEYGIKKGVGPVVDEPLRTSQQVAALRHEDPREVHASLLETIRRVKSELPPETPLIGFAGGPFTLACYLTEGRPSRTFKQARTMIHAEPETWHALMTHLATVTTGYLQAQIDAGVDALQLFDSWVGLLGPATYREAVFPHSQQIFRSLADAPVPTIHFGTGTATLLPSMRDAGGDVIGVDWRVPLAAAWRQVGHDRAVQGNLDPALLLGPFAPVAKATRRLLSSVAGRPGHIFNLGHGVLPETPLDHLQRLVHLVHQETEHQHLEGA